MNVIDIQSRFQHIELQQHPFIKGEFILLLDRSWQFDTSLEYRYHESLITIPYAVAPSICKTLIAGGGDGMAVREALKFQDVKEITLVEIDPEMIRIFKQLDYLNNKALHSENLKIAIGDAVKFVENGPKEYYDAITLDFPSPTAKNVQKDYINLFSPAVLNKFIDALAPHGILSSQVSIRSNFLAGYAQCLFNRGFMVWNFDTYYDRKGNHDSFLIACRSNLVQERQLPSPLRFVTPAHIDSALSERRQLTPEEMEDYRLFAFAEQVEYDIL